MNSQAELKSEHRRYLAKHPELKTLLNDFMAQVLVEKPADVVAFAAEYFKRTSTDVKK